MTEGYDKLIESLIEKDKQYLIDLIIWYRDEYHHDQNLSHNDLIKMVESATNFDQLSLIEQIVDSWLD